MTKTYAVAITARQTGRKPIQRSAIRRKPRKRQTGDNPAYRAFVRTFACILCVRPIGLLIRQGQEVVVQLSNTECAHVGRRGLSQKCPDCESLPLCALEHHRIGPKSHHTLGKRFWGFHGLNRVALITQLQALYEVESGKPARLRRKVRVPGV
jgi:hypothetical protein